MQTQDRLQINFFYILLVGVVILTFFIILPYVQALFLGAILAVLAYPFYQKMRFACFGSRNFGAFFTTVIVFFVIVVPLSVLIFLLFQEAKQAYIYFTDGGGGLALADYAGRVQIFLNGFLPANLVPETTIGDLQGYFNSVYGWFGTHFTSIFSNSIYFLLNLIVFVLSIFFFLRDGVKFREFLVKLSPLSPVHNEKLLSSMATSVRSVVKGSLFVALVQGTLISIGFWFFGVQSPILWGLLSAIAALLPGLGAFFVVVPMAVYVAFTSGVWYGAGIFIWTIVLVLITDNILRPLLLEHGIKIHPLFILLSVLGGIALFGPLGFLIGPIVLSLLFALMEIHSDVVSIAK